MANITGSKIQIRKADNTALYPRVRTVDLVESTTDTGIFNGNIIKVDYLPKKTTIGPKTGNGSATNDYVATEKAVRDAIDEVNQALATGVLSVDGTNGLNHVPNMVEDPDNPGTQIDKGTVGNVVISGNDTDGNGSTKGVVITSNVASNKLNATGVALGLTAPATNAKTSTLVVPTWDTLYNVTSMLTSKINSAQENAAGKHSHANTETYGVYLSQDGTTWTAAAKLAGPAQYGTIYKATSETIYSATDANKVGRAVTQDLINTYYGVARVTSVYDIPPVLTALPTGVVAGNLILAKSSGTNGNLGIYYASGTKLVAATMQKGVVYCSTAAGADIYVYDISGTASRYLPIASVLKSVSTTLANALTTVAGSNGVTTTNNSTVTGVNVSAITILSNATVGANAETKAKTVGVVHTVSDITANGIALATSAATSHAGMYDGTSWESALKNNVVPTVAAIRGACLFYTDL